MTEQQSAWNTFRDQPFPAEARAMEINGLDLVLLDGDTAGLLTTHFDGTVLSDAQQDLLHILTEDLQEVIASTDGEVRKYFAQLSDVASAVYRDLPK
jgi:hypothetical protein